MGDKVITFHFELHFPETNELVRMHYTYDLETRTLVSNPIRILSSLYREDSDFAEIITDKTHIQDFLYRHNLTMYELVKLNYWFLFERILGEWFEVSGRFSYNNLGNFIFLDTSSY
ncbi:MAG: hypothetical protein FWF50_00515 [Defluviitaleaceae bacterium]|nr:hypothetical protein [Defluviitaleaceae bacterium]